MTGEKKSSYSPHEAQEILRRAAEKSVQSSDEIAHEDLLSAAKDAGMSEANVEAAAREYALEKQQHELAMKLRTEARQGLVAHSLTYVAVNVGLYFLAQATHAQSAWWAYVVAIWGVFLLLNLIGALKDPTPEELQCALQRSEYAKQRAAQKLELKAKREVIGAQHEPETDRHDSEGSTSTRAERRAEKQARKEARKLAQQALSIAIDKSVNAALKAAAKTMENVASKVETNNQQAASAETDFAKFVAQKKSQSPRTSANSQPVDDSSAPAATKVRVNVHAEPSERSSTEPADQANAPTREGAMRSKQ
jgi:hypothetical protein